MAIKVTYQESFGCIDRNARYVDKLEQCSAVRFVLFVEVELRISMLGFLGVLPDDCLEVDKFECRKTKLLSQKRRHLVIFCISFL